MPLLIDYESRKFPSAMTLLNGYHTLTTSWDDLLWAAVTVGRPNRQFVFQHGKASVYEALFRFSLVKMSLEQYGWGSHKKLRRTAAARTLDPTEKGAVNYFLGLALCKLFADSLLDAPWMLHLDVFRPDLDVQLASRSRPDLIGQTRGGQWISLECKGRLSAPDKKSMQRAKHQATRVVSIGGVAPSYFIGGFAFFKNDVLRFEWEDPEPEPGIRNPIRVTVRPDDWRLYYRPVLEIIRSAPGELDRMMEEPFLTSVNEADLKVGIAPEVLRRIQKEQWDEAREVAQDATNHAIGDAVGGPRYHADGIALEAGPSWSERRVEEG